MTGYDWPSGKAAKERDDALGREGFLLARRTDFDLEGALAAARAAVPAPQPRGRRGGLAAPASGRALLWLPLGPDTVVNGQAVGRPRIAGRVRALAVHPDGERIYAAAANGGIWYSGDGGGSWQSIGGFASTPSLTVPRLAHRNACGAIHVKFGAAAATDVVYVGTGEPGWRKGQPGGKLGGFGVLVATGPATSAADDPWTLEARILEGEGIYRIAEEPGGTTIVAATTNGLWQRGAAGDPWSRVAGNPFHDLQGTVTDVLWTAADAGTSRPKRLWAWISTGNQAGLWVRAGGATDFTKVATAGATANRAVLAAANPPDTVYVFNNSGPGFLAALYQVTAAGNAAPTAQRVTGIPNMVGGQGEYDLAMAVDPSNPAVVVLGGMTFAVPDPAGAGNDSDGAIFTGTVGGAPITFGGSTHIGIGVHSDVHFLTFSNNGARLFASCDGGVFRSDSPSKPAGFYARNNGLSVIQANYLGAHPTCEGWIVTGLQDNGIIERASNGVWRHTGDGDGGGVVLNPLSPDTFFRQFFGGFWTISPLERGGVGVYPAIGDDERKHSSFYSTPAVTTHTRNPGPGAVTVGQLLVPTTRVWYSEDFGTTWVTLPTGTDPWVPAYNGAQDKFKDEITVCRWQTSDVAWILSETQIHRLVRTAGSDNGGPPGSWTKSLVIEKGVKNKKDETSAEGPIREAGVWTDIAINLEADGSPHGSKGALYLGTSGHPDNADVDTLWWFDGIETWYPTGLRGTIPAPVTAVLADPATPNTVYVGTTVGVWRGIQTLHSGDAPTWAWEALLNGLPEACVEDLALFDDGGIRLLRAAIVARGVWELRLNSNVEDLTYVRAHDDDLRYRPRAVELARDQVALRSWHGSPDVRPRVATTAGAVPTDLPWSFSKQPLRVAEFRRFQAACRSKFTDPRFRATGIWDRYFDEVLRDHGAPVIAGVVLVNNAFYTTVRTAPHSTAEAWGAGDPREADLYDFGPELTEGTLASTSMRLPAGPAKVDVLVHRRGLDPIDGGQVRVTLLRWIDPRTRNRAQPGDSTTWFSGNIAWAGAVNDVLNSAGGTTAQSLGPGWAFMGTTAAARRKTLTGQTLDNLHPGLATFDLNLTGFTANRVVLVVAVIRDDTASAIAAASLRDLALTDSHVAVRSVRIGI